MYSLNPIQPMYFLAGITAFVFTFVLVLVALWLFPKIGFMDRPHKYGLTRESIPYYGGLTMIVAFFASVFLFVPVTKQLIGVLVGLTIIIIVSFLDDRFQVKPIIRLAVQAISAVIVSLFGVGVRSITNPLGGVLALDALHFNFFGHEVLIISLLFTIFWVVLVVNSMNFFDGVPGLLSGISCIAAIVLFLLSLRTGHVIDQNQLIFLSIIVAGISGAFVFFDFPTPKILMGDTGSMFLGFLLAVSAIFAGGKIATALIVLGIPLLDAIWSAVRRILKGKSPFVGDMDHLHHRLLRAGFSQRQVILLMYVISASFGVMALFLSSYQKMLATFAIIFTMILLSILLFWRMRRGAKTEAK
ncbi:MAG: MraY family glycosyltransferase [Candidatus Gracilibacteria bacterium]